MRGKRKGKDETQRAPRKYYRNGITLIDLMRMFPDDATAERWFVEGRWPDGVRCPYCNSDRATHCTHKTIPFRSPSCRTFFSVKTNTVMHTYRIGFQKWGITIYLMTTGIKGISSMKLHREIGVTQKTAWHTCHRTRKRWEQGFSLYEGRWK